jgi:hypothetical protein
VFDNSGLSELFVNGIVSLYPNPVNDQLTVSFDSKESFEVEVVLTDIAGRQIIRENHLANQGLNKLTYNLERFGKGIYLLNLISEKGTLNYKVIVK